MQRRSLHQMCSTRTVGLMFNGPNPKTVSVNMRYSSYPVTDGHYGRIDRTLDPTTRFSSPLPTSDRKSSRETSNIFDSSWNSERRLSSLPLQETASRTVSNSNDGTTTHRPQSLGQYTPDNPATKDVTALEHQSLDNIWLHNAPEFLSDGSRAFHPLQDLHSQKSMEKLCLALPSNAQIQR